MIDDSSISKTELVDRIAASLSERAQLLKLLSMNNYDMEANSRPEFLTEFKLSYGESMRNVQRIPDMFSPFMFGTYPYTADTGKQKAAMKAASVLSWISSTPRSPARATPASNSFSALRDFAKREETALATKHLPRTQHEIAGGISSQRHIEKMINRNLQNPGMDRVDLYGLMGAIKP